MSGDIHSLTDFKRNTAEFLKQLKKTGRPTVLTIHGKAELVVQDAQAYQRLLDLAERLEAMEGIRSGLEDMRAGRTRTLDEFKDEVRTVHGIPL